MADTTQIISRIEPQSDTRRSRTIVPMIKKPKLMPALAGATALDRSEDVRAEVILAFVKRTGELHARIERLEHQNRLLTQRLAARDKT